MIPAIRQMSHHIRSHSEDRARHLHYDRQVERSVSDRIGISTSNRAYGQLIMQSGSSVSSVFVAQPVEESYHFEVNFVCLVCRVSDCDHADPSAVFQAAQHEVDSTGL